MKISKKRLFVALVAYLSLVIVGCATVGEGQAMHSDVDVSGRAHSEESVILSKIAAMKAGEKTTVDGVTFVAGKTFSAASGHNCRSILIVKGLPVDGARERLACNSSGNWFFSKNIFMSELGNSGGLAGE